MMPKKLTPVAIYSVAAGQFPAGGMKVLVWSTKFPQFGPHHATFNAKKCVFLWGHVPVTVTNWTPWPLGLILTRDQLTKYE